MKALNNTPHSLQFPLISHLSGSNRDKHVNASLELTVHIYSVLLQSLCLLLLFLFWRWQHEVPKIKSLMACIMSFRARALLFSQFHFFFALVHVRAASLEIAERSLGNDMSNVN